VTYDNTDTVVVTFHPDHTKTLTEAFVGTSNSYDTFNHTVGMSNSGTFASAPGTSGGATSSNHSDDNGTDEYQFQSFTLVGADQTTTQVSDESGSGSDEYSGFDSQSASSQGVSNVAGGSGNSSSSFSMDSVSGNDRYKESSTDSQTIRVVGLATYINGVASFVSIGSGGDQYVGLDSSSDHQEYASPYGTVWTTDNSHFGTDSGDDSYKFNSVGNTLTNNAATSTSGYENTESGNGSDTYLSIDSHHMGWVANSPGASSKMTLNDDSQTSGNDQYQYSADDGGTSSTNGTSSNYTDGSTQSKGNDIYSATDSLDYTLTSGSLSNNPNGSTTFSGQPVPAAIAGGGSSYQIDNSSLSTVQGKDQYSTNDANHLDWNSELALALARRGVRVRNRAVGRGLADRVEAPVGVVQEGTLAVHDHGQPVRDADRVRGILTDAVGATLPQLARQALVIG
jgi:hypothetical protein